MRNALLLLTMLLVAASIGAQNPVDSSYIRLYPDHLQVAPAMRYHHSKISLSVPGKENLTYEHSGMTFATRVQFDKWGMGLSVPTRIFNGQRLSSSLGFNLQLFPKSLVINAGLNRRKGFEEQNGQTLLRQTPYLDQQNLRLWHLYFNPIYVFSKNKYSLRSALQLTQRQLKSAGSPLLALRTEYLQLKGDATDPFSENAGARFSGYHFWQNGIEAGYGYNWIFSKHYFISAKALGGIAYTRTAYQIAEEKIRLEKWQWIAIGDLNLTIGYQSDRYFAALQCNYRNRPIDTNGINVYANELQFQVTWGMRLHAPGLRRAIDLRSKSFARQFVSIR